MDEHFSFFFAFNVVKIDFFRFPDNENGKQCILCLIHIHHISNIIRMETWKNSLRKHFFRRCFTGEKNSSPHITQECVHWTYISYFFTLINLLMSAKCIYFIQHALSISIYEFTFLIALRVKSWMQKRVEREIKLENYQLEVSRCYKIDILKRFSISQPWKFFKYYYIRVLQHHEELQWIWKYYVEF